MDASPQKPSVDGNLASNDTEPVPQKPSASPRRSEAARENGRKHTSGSGRRVLRVDLQDASHRLMHPWQTIPKVARHVGVSADTLRRRLKGSGLIGF